MPSLIIASGPVIVEDGKVLLSKHGDTTFWKFCGGRIESLNESLKEAASRKAKQEVGIDLEFADQDPFITYTTKATDQGVADVILVHFLAKRVGEVTPGADIRETKWLPIDSLPKDDLAPNILPALEYFGFFG